MVAGINAWTRRVPSISSPFRTHGIGHLRNMKVVIVFMVVVAYVMADRLYTTKYDNINLDQILNNERLLNSYVKCLEGKGNCTPDGKELKEALPDALETDCSRCSEKQKSGSEKVIRNLVNKHPDIWERLAKQYDPENKYTAKYQEQAKQAGIVL